MGFRSKNAGWKFQSWSRKARRKSIFAHNRRLRAEILEDRRLLALIAWDGGAGTTSWLDAANWSPNQVPGPTDDVHILPVISGRPTVTLSGVSTSVNSLFTNSATIEIVNGELSVANNVNLTMRTLVDLNNGTFENFGDMRFDEGNGIQGKNSSNVVNMGTLHSDLDLSDPLDYAFVYPATGFDVATSITFVNHGSVDIGSGVFYIAASTLGNGAVHSGEFSIAAGASLRIIGKHTFDDDIHGAGTLIVDGFGYTETINGQLDPALTVQSIGSGIELNADTSVKELQTGTGFVLSGSGDLTIGHRLLWAGGSMTGTGQTHVASGAALELPFVPSRTLSRTLTSADSDVVIGGPATINNGSFLNAGTLEVTENIIPNRIIDVSLLNNGRVENNGQLWFGVDDDHAAGLQVRMTINNGSLDLTGGANSQSIGSNVVAADLAMFFGHNKGEKYSIDFTGPGSITVDQSGIWVYRQNSAGTWSATKSTYQDLWAAGILKAYGLSGLDGAVFSDFFAVAGASGNDNYKLTSLVQSGTGIARGFVFEDANGNGVFDSINGDKALSNVTMEMRNLQGSFVMATKSGPSGTFAFANVASGTYTVRQSAATDTNLDGTPDINQDFVLDLTNAVVTLSPGKASTLSNDLFGNTILGSIHGVKFHDLDGDGVWGKGPEPPLAGIKLDLFKFMGATTKQIGPVFVTKFNWVHAGQATTNSLGEFDFTGLTPGKYEVVELSANNTSWVLSTGQLTKSPVSIDADNDFNFSDPGDYAGLNPDVSNTMLNIRSRREFAWETGASARPIDGQGGPLDGVIDPGEIAFAQNKSVLKTEILALPNAQSTLFDSLGFEAPTYSTAAFGGKLDGQPLGQPIGWQRSGSGPSTANVQSTVFAPGSGTQAVQLNRAASAIDRWGVQFTNAPQTNTVSITWAMRVQGPAGNPAGQFGPFFGVEAYDDTSSFVGLIGSLGVDATTGDVLYQAANTGSFAETGSTVAFGAWNNFEIRMNFTAKQYSLFLNGAFLRTEGFVDQNNKPGGINRITDATLAGLMAVPNSDALSGTAYFDNFAAKDIGTPPAPSLWFGNLRLGTINGFVFDDANGDGDYQTSQGDLPLRDVRMELREAATGKFAGTAFTDANGNFAFQNLFPGSYRVSQSNLTDTNKDFIPDTSQGLVIDPFLETAAIQSGQTVQLQHQFANSILGGIRGVKFRDSNADGEWDKAATQHNAEPALPGLLFDLYKFVGTEPQLVDGQIVTTYKWQQVAGTVSNNLGQFHFLQLSPGIYEVVEREQLSEILTTGQLTDAPDGDPAQSSTAFTIVSRREFTWELGPTAAGGPLNVQVLATPGDDPTPGTTPAPGNLERNLFFGNVPDFAVSFVSASQTVSESAGGVNVQLILSEPSTHTVAVPLTFTGAASSTDYSLPAGNILTIPAGQRIGSLTLQIVNDTLEEPAEQIIVSLPPGYSRGLPAGLPLTHTILIPQNDLPSVSFASTQRNAAENVGQFAVQVNLSAPSMFSISVPFNLLGTATTGLDYTLSPTTTLVIPAGSQTGSINLTINNDILLETSESLQLRLGTPTNATLGANQAFLANIIDDDTPTLSFAAIDQVVWEDIGTANVEVRLIQPAPHDVSVRLAVRHYGNLDDSDYAIQRAPIVIPAGQLSATIPVQIFDNAENASFGISGYIAFFLVQPQGAILGSQFRHDMTIRDNDPLVNFRSFYEAEFDVEGNLIRLDLLYNISAGESQSHYGRREVLLSAATNKPVMIPFSVVRVPSVSRNKAAMSGQDYSVLSSSPLIIPAGQTSGIIDVRINNDTIDELDEDYKIVLRTPVNAVLGPHTEFRTTILDDDVPAARLRRAGQSVSVKEGNTFPKKNYQDITVEATINPVPLAPVNIPIGVSAKGAKEGTDFTISTKTLRFTGGTSSFTIRVFDDKVVEDTETISVWLKDGPSGVDVNNAKFTIKITDNDTKSTSNKKNSSSVGQLEIPEDIPDVKIPKAGKEPSGSGSVVNVGALILDGYIQGSSAFFDANQNGVPDFLDLNNDGTQGDDEPSEPFTISEIDGSFEFDIPQAFDRNLNGEIDDDEGRWVALAGVDTSTNIPLGLRLVAPVDVFAISPLSTVMSELMSGHGVALGDAEQRVLEAFDLPPAELAVLNFPYEAANGNVVAADIFAGAAQIQNTVAAAASLLSGLPEAVPYVVLGDLGFADIAAKIVDPSSKLDLGNPIVVASIIEGMLFRSGLTLSTAQVAGAAEVVAEANRLIQLVTNTADFAFVNRIAKIQKVVQGTLADTLKSVGAGTVEILTVTQSFSGAALEEHVQNALIGVVVPPAIIVNDVIKNEGYNGQQVYEFTVSLVGESPLQVTVDYASSDSTAESEDGDYQPVSGSLSWGPGDNSSRKIQVVVAGDEKFEPDESFLLVLDNAANAAIREQVGVGFLVNDDALVYHAPTDTEANKLVLTADGEVLSLYVNDELEIAGTFFNPVPISIVGAPSIPDSLDIQVVETSKILAGGLSFLGGHNGDDRLDIHDGTATSTIHTLTGAGSGSFDVDSRLISYSGIEHAEDALTPQIAGAPEFVTAGQLVALQSSVIDFADDTLFGYEWEVEYSGHIVATSINPNLQFTPANSGDYVVRLTISADERGPGTDVLTFTVVGAPTADAGGPYVVNEGAAIALDGTGSTDPENDIISFEWDLDYDGVNFNTDAVGPQPSLTFADNFAARGIALRVTDSHGETDIATSTLAVNNVAPTANAGGPYVTFDDVPIMLSGTAFDVAGISDPLTFAWDLDNSGTFETTVTSPIFNPAALGFTGTQTKTVKLRVTDGDGGEAIVTTTVSIVGQGTTQVGGVIYVVGGATANDTIAITLVGNNIRVTSGSSVKNFAQSGVAQIHVRGRGGNDIISATSGISKPMTIDGSTGNDILTGGSGRNVLIGDAGNDILTGGPADDVLLGGAGNDILNGAGGNDALSGGDGNDVIDGAAGRDLLIGGRNKDVLSSGNDEDILVGGYTAHDNSVAALDAVMALWKSTASFDSRVATLSGVGGQLRAGVTVFDDDDRDTINGGTSRDLIFGDTSKLDGLMDTISLESALDVLVPVN